MTLKNSILATLSYHDIFDYPLKKEEIARYLIGQAASPKKIEKSLKSLKKNKKVFLKRGLYYLKGRQDTVKIRSLKSRYSKSKLKRANFYANFLKLLPTLKMVAVSGALAMENSRKKDDIDLTIIASSNTIWTTRLLTNLLLQPFRRKPNKPHTDSKACLNLFLDELGLKIRHQNLYTAHEIAQLKPIWDRNKTYNRFINENNWLKKYLPNWQPPSIVNSQSTIARKRSREVSKKVFVANRLTLVVEIFFKKLQLFYMRKKISTERIGEHQLFFHPKDTQNWVLKEYEKRLKKPDLLR